MKKRQIRKLSLSRETLRGLEHPSLREVAGGMPSTRPGCSDECNTAELRCTDTCYWFSACLEC
jgi:hypothetical protein